MKLRTIAKLAVIVSVVLFCIGVGFYSFAQLKMVDDDKDTDLLALVPADCLGVLETDNMEFLVNELSQVNYAAQLDTTLRRSSLLSVVFNNLAPYIKDGVHGLRNRMDRVMLSMHAPVSPDNIVVYFRTNRTDNGFLKSVFQEADKSFVAKKEAYRGKTIEIYPLKDGNFVSVYSGSGFLAVSLQKRLIEEVIDAERDKNSLANDSSFASGYHPKKSNFITIYAHRGAMPLLEGGDGHCWSGFDLYFNSEVFYLSGSMNECDSCMSQISGRMEAIEPVVEDSLVILSGAERVDSCISAMLALPERNIFQECASNLSRDASFIMVADMDRLNADVRRFSPFMPHFFSRHAALFRSFILSLQITHVENRLSYLYIFTFKE